MPKSQTRYRLEEAGKSEPTPEIWDEKGAGILYRRKHFKIEMSMSECSLLETQQRYLTPCFPTSHMQQSSNENKATVGKFL